MLLPSCGKVVHSEQKSRNALSNSCEIDIKIIQALIEVESGGNPKARNKRTGASGILQVMPSTAKAMGYSPKDMFDPKLGKEAGIKYLCHLKNDVCNGGIECALQAYNCGPNKRNGRACIRFKNKVMRISNAY